MRYADGPTAEAEVRVEAAPSVVWIAVTDITLPARFSDELQEAFWAEGVTGPQVGARFVGRSAHPAIGTWQTVSEVVACEPGHRFAWDVTSDQGVSSSWGFELHADGDGTRLRQWGRMGPGPSGLSPAIAATPDKEERIIARRLEEWRRNMTRTVEGIKATVEGG